MMKGIESKIEQSEVRMSTKFETLATSHGSRLEKTELLAITQAQEEMKEIRNVASEANIMGQVLARQQAVPSREPGPRPRFYKRSWF